MSGLVADTTSLRDRLADAGIIVPMGVAGLYGKGAVFIDLFAQLDGLLGRVGPVAGVERFRFPPLLPRADLVRTDYLRGFPDLVGSVHAFRGDDAAHRRLLATVEQSGDWSAAFDAADTVLLPAACYPLYPMVHGALPARGRTFDVLGLCFRHEPSDDPARMQSFHQREHVHIGAPDDAAAFRNRWLERALELFDDLGLDVRAEVANDPFFGRAGRLLGANQRASELKYEIVTTVADARPTAIASANWHLDHLTSAFGISLEDGGMAHSACIGFGMERIVLALLARHGLDPSRWPAPVRERLT